MRVTLIVMLCLSILVGCSSNKTNDFSTWDEEEVYRYLNEVQHYVSDMPIETDSKEKIVKLYENYFSPELSVQIVDSLYVVEVDNGWIIPDGDGGYMFSVPNKEQHNVVITINENTIIVEELYEPETWMYSKMQYTITYDKKPLITEWIIE